MVLGGVEVLAGALLFIIPTPLTRGLAFFLFSDGIGRFADDTQKNDEEKIK